MIRWVRRSVGFSTTHIGLQSGLGCRRRVDNWTNALYHTEVAYGQFELRLSSVQKTISAQAVGEKAGALRTGGRRECGANVTSAGWQVTLCDRYASTPQGLQGSRPPNI